jgi:hypothetical protein
MAWRFHDDGFAFYKSACVPVCHARTCGARQHSGSHVTCVCLPDHDGPHESEDGDQWEDEP